MRQHIIEVMRTRGQETYFGRTKRDNDILLNYLGVPYFYRAGYIYALHVLSQYGYSLLVEEPFDEDGGTSAKPLPHDPNDVWFH